MADAERALNAELELAKRLHRLQSRDSRIGFEASNQYYYVPMDLAEKVLSWGQISTVDNLRAMGR